MRSCLELRSVIVSRTSTCCGGGHLLCSSTAQWSSTMLSLVHEGSPSIAGPGVSATYHYLWRRLVIHQFLGVQSPWVLKVPNCLMGDPLYAVKHVEDGLSPVGFPSLSNLLGNSLANVRRGMMLPPASVSTLHFRVASLFFPMSAGNSILAKASIPVIFMSSMVVVSSSHKAWLQGTTPAPTAFRADAVPVPTSFRTVATFTSSQWASASVSTSWILFCWGLDPPLGWGWCCPVAACHLLVVLHLCCQCPIFPHAPHLVALAGQEVCPGVCCTVQLPHECCCCSCYHCCGGLCCPLAGPFCGGPFWIAWTVLELPRPMASISPLIAMWVLQTSNILAVVSIMGKVRSFFTRSLLSRALTSRYCTFHSFSSSDGKLQQSASILRRSTNLLGDSPGWMQVSSSL